METQASLVGSDRVIELHPVTALVTNITLVIGPGHAEHDNPIGLRHAFHDLHLVINGFVCDVRENRVGDLGNRLVKFQLPGITFPYPVHETLEINWCFVHSPSSMVFLILSRNDFKCQPHGKFAHLAA